MSANDRCQFCEQPGSLDGFCPECFCCQDCCPTGAHCEDCGQPTKVCEATLCGDGIDAEEHVEAA